MIPLYAVGNKALGYIYCLCLLIVLILFKPTRSNLAVISGMAGLLMWIHPVIFLGPGLAIFLIALMLNLFGSYQNTHLKDKLVAGSMSLAIFSAIVLPCVFLYSSSILRESEIVKGLSAAEKIEMRDDYKEDRGP